MNAVYSNELVLLKPLDISDARRFYEIYKQPVFFENGGNNVFLENETAPAFTERIRSTCECIFTIRPTGNKDLIIGDCALHHWNRATNEIEIGGSLFQAYWGKGYMKSAFELLMNIARDWLNIKVLIGKTQPDNHNAIRLAEKMGFEKVYEDFEKTILQKRLE